MDKREGHLPAAIGGLKVRYRFGLISDTHMPERWHRIPETLPEIFAGVTMILHAGDVGELWVLDQLGAIAPVIAVHGNDEPSSTPHHLPAKQIVTAAEQRILVWHGHYPDRVDELESRRWPDIRPKLERIAQHGRQVEARMVHFGHWHVPLLCEIEGVLLVNAGAIASGNFVTRQLVQTVAIASLLEDGRFHITHIDLAGCQLHHPPDVTDTDFVTAAQPYIGSILAPELEAELPRLRDNPILLPALRRLAPRCWWGGQASVSRTDLIMEIEQITPATSEQGELLAILRS